MPEVKAKNEKALYKYTQLMKNIINIQERKGKIESECKKNGPKASIKSVKDGKKSVVASLKTNCSNRSKKPPITRKPSSVSNLNPLRTILKNSQSNENLKRVGREPTTTRPINHVDNFRSRSADFSSFQKCSMQKSVDWNNLKDLIDLHLSEFSSKDKTIKPCIQTELEVKLNEMKQEIDDLKQTIRNQEFKPHKKAETQAIDSELSHGLNCIISNYSEKLAYINQQIVNMKNKKGSENVSKQAPYNKNIKFSHDYLDQVESELKEYKVKCSQLELELDSKNKQIEEYSALFKEISENVSGLIMEMENKGKETTSESMSVNVTESKSINNLLMNLAKFEKAIKPENGLERAKKKSKDLSTTDTLIDADSSFADFAESLKRANFNSRGFNHQLNLINNLNENQVLKPFTENDLLKKQKKNFFCTKSVVTNLKNQFNDLYHDEDDEEKIVFNMEDLSITTIQTSANTTETVESMPPLKNDQDDEFQKDLDILDQKILKVKKMIDSMKNT